MSQSSYASRYEVCISTIDDLSYTPSTEEQARDAAQIHATGRKSWKTLKGKGEAVWPSYLEAALFEALDKYRPENAGSAKLSGRFPMRNKFISNYILKLTGKKRTPRQVGSRLQQLRDTSGGKQLLDMYSQRQRGVSDIPKIPKDENTFQIQDLDNCDALSASTVTSSQGSDANSVFSGSLSPSPPPSPLAYPYESHADSGYPVASVVYISIPCSSSLEDPHYYNTQSSLPQYPDSNGHLLDPSVTFSSSCSISARSSCAVYIQGVDAPVHVESFPLICCSPPAPDNSSWLYCTKLVPSYWETICGSNDLTRYTIRQEITELLAFDATTANDSSPVFAGNNMVQGRVLSATIYRFKYSSPPPLRDSLSSTLSAENSTSGMFYDNFSTDQGHYLLDGTTPYYDVPSSLPPRYRATPDYSTSISV